MRMSPGTVVLTAALCAFAGTIAFDVAHARVPAAFAQGAGGLPEGEGKAVVEKLCSGCHGLEYLVPSQRTVRGWVEVIDLMRGYGAEATDDQWKTITDYIIANIAYLHVNKGAAEEFGLFFMLDEKTAQGVVAYRETQGGFKTAADLKQAPGLDAASIDALDARLIFQ